jgi:NAD(P)-dependent dehydrogenase (short-subunit alcohol dehydrogenase family)
VTARRALVTGASRGIGRAVALELAREGRMLVLAARFEEGLHETRRLVEAAGGAAVTLRCDLSHREESQHLVERAAEAAGGSIDVLAHVAGLAPSSKTVEATDADWDEAMEVNATAAFIMARAALPAMLHQRWGRIVVVASTAGRTGYAYTAAYTASKHALIGLVRALAVEVAKHGVTVNAACPGFAETALLEEAVRNIVERTGASAEEARRRLAGMSPQQRFIEPEEIARVVAFLASEGALGINGQAVTIDGGAVTA